MEKKREREKATYLDIVVLYFEWEFVILCCYYTSNI